MKLKIEYTGETSSGTINATISEGIGQAILIMSQGKRNLLMRHYSRCMGLFRQSSNYNENLVNAVRYGRLKVSPAPKRRIS